MSKFSDMLKNYIHTKDIKVGTLAHYCEVERSTVYKFINGKREPASLELVEQMAYFMKLTPSETRQLQEAWKMARMGEDTYYITKSIERFLTDFPSRSVTPAGDYAFSGSVAEFASSQNCLLLNSRQALDSAVHQILLSEASSEEGKVALFLQPDYPFLLHLLSTLQPSGAFQVDHIFSLNRTAQFTENHDLYELHYLRNLFPVYINGLNYRIHCFYTDEHSNFQNLSTFPYMILTSEFAISCTSDYQMGILYQDPDIVQAMWNLFYSYRDLCQSVFQTFPIAISNLQDLFQYVAASRSDAAQILSIQPEACILPFLRRNLITELLNYDIPGIDAAVPAIDAICASNMKNIQDGKFFVYFTEYGMSRFLNEGLFEEIPAQFYHPLNKEQRIRVLHGISDCCQSGAYRILKKPLSHLSENLRMVLSGNVCTLTYQTNAGNHMCFSISEPFVLEIFRNFLENMDPDVYYSPAEAVKIVEKLIHQVETL